MPLLRRLAAWFTGLDPVIAGTTLLLVLFGVAAIYSLTINADVPDFGKFARQLVALGLGLVLLTVASRIDYRLFRGYAGLLYLGGILLLVAVLFVGETIRGTKGWFTVGLVNVQPVELTKVFLVLLLARLFADELGRPPSFGHLVRSGLLAALAAGLVFLQPDVGSGLVLVSVWIGMLLLVYRKPKHLVLLGVGLAAVALISWFSLFGSLQRDRILTFFDPARDPLGRGYQVTQSKIAVGSGELFGRGLGLGPQSQLNFLPDQETDFIFAVIAEELGFVGALLVLGCFAVFFLRLLHHLREVRDPFSFLAIAGFLILFGIQVFVNIGMNIGLLPITGIPLPFVSYGGSSLLANLFAIGILLSMTRHQRT